MITLHIKQEPFCGVNRKSHRLKRNNRNKRNIRSRCRTLESAANGSHFWACAAGSAFPAPGAQIAAIAAAHDFAVASRDAAAFKAAGLVVVDPWTATTSS
ncbi:hypothetical protein [Reyranella sp.]|jgi:predicted nucleic acid-binding protein|uniref:hypothetical protein n=1 Tax=Reyranella sp. TaxID=1929291 RepID=UPI00387E910A